MKDLRGRAPQKTTRGIRVGEEPGHEFPQLIAAYRDVAQRAAALYAKDARFRGELARDAASQPSGDVDGTPLQVIDGGAL